MSSLDTGQKGDAEIGKTVFFTQVPEMFIFTAHDCPLLVTAISSGLSSVWIDTLQSGCVIQRVTLTRTPPSLSR